MNEKFIERIQDIALSAPKLSGEEESRQMCISEVNYYRLSDYLRERSMRSDYDGLPLEDIKLFGIPVVIDECLNEDECRIYLKGGVVRHIFLTGEEKKVMQIKVDRRKKDEGGRLGELSYSDSDPSERLDMIRRVLMNMPMSVRGSVQIHINIDLNK
jgi:hypothetical protein